MSKNHFHSTQCQSKHFHIIVENQLIYSREIMYIKLKCVEEEIQRNTVLTRIYPSIAIVRASCTNNNIVQYNIILKCGRCMQLFQRNPKDLFKDAHFLRIIFFNKLLPNGLLQLLTLPRQITLLFCPSDQKTTENLF